MAQTFPGSTAARKASLEATGRIDRRTSNLRASPLIVTLVPAYMACCTGSSESPLESQIAVDTVSVDRATVAALASNGVCAHARDADDASCPAERAQTTCVTHRLTSSGGQMTAALLVRVQIFKLSANVDGSRFRSHVSLSCRRSDSADCEWPAYI